MRVSRMTMRRRMMTAAIIALAASIAVIAAYWRWWDVRAEYLSRAWVHSTFAKVFELRENIRTPGGEWSLQPSLFDEHGVMKEDVVARWERNRAYHLALERNTGAAAALPWLPVEDDPPKPQ